MERGYFISLCLSVVAAGLFVTGSAFADPKQGPIPFDPMAMAHSHNDYLQDRPLYEALGHGFRSVEADVFLMGGELILSHIGLITYGSLEEVYLKPLQALVNQRGSVLGDGQPFTLWIDLKGSPRGMADKLFEVLSRYPMLSWFSDSGCVENAVTIVLTGDEDAKKEFVEKYPDRPAIRDSNEFSTSDPAANWKWSWYALSWEDHIDWDGTGSISEREYQKLRQLVGAIHGKGKRVRFFDAPESENYWGMMRREVIDLVGSDHLTKMKDYLVQHPIVKSLRSLFLI